MGRSAEQTPVSSIQVNEQFGREKLDTIEEGELCAPSVKILRGG